MSQYAILAAGPLAALAFQLDQTEDADAVMAGVEAGTVQLITYNADGSVASLSPVTSVTMATSLPNVADFGADANAPAGAADTQEQAEEVPSMAETEVPPAADIGAEAVPAANPIGAAG